MLTGFILSVLSAYGFSVAVQLLRGSRLNFKPFNCKFCLSYWYALVIILLFSPDGSVLYNAVVIPFAVACVVHFIKIIEDRLTG